MTLASTEYVSSTLADCVRSSSRVVAAAVAFVTVSPTSAVVISATTSVAVAVVIALRRVVARSSVAR
ncbi:hypothetical protein [Haloferax sulfurifontis]|uniref:hypothetical protein n=1 Tax=Haloferax sulfurifontis TaxID=255616 RepID=UPI001667E585|nr:hypothetical protein [Haloferax sulfurifontis]